MNVSSQLSGGRAIRLIQLSDCHLGADEHFKLAGVRTASSLGAVLSTLAPELPACELLLVSGDIAADGEQDSYTSFEKLLPEGTPLAWLPGNHDDFILMQRILKQPFRRAVVLGDWVVVSLVSAIAGRVGGMLCDTELAELKKLLAKYRDYHVALFVHHPPAPVNCLWLDRQRIGNHQALESLLSDSPNVRAIFSGHVHQDFATRWAGLPVYTAPSTCFQFSAGSDEFAIADQAPGYRWIDLCPDGSVETGVVYADQEGWQVDHRCIGY